MRKKTKQIIAKIVSLSDELRQANDELKHDLGPEILKLLKTKDLEGLEKMFDELPECFLRYLFLDIEKLKIKSRKK